MEKCGPINEFQNERYLTRSDTVTIPSDNKVNRKLVSNYERQPSLSYTCNSCDGSIKSIIDDMISDDNDSIFSGSISKSSTAQCYSAEKGRRDLVDNMLSDSNQCQDQECNEIQNTTIHCSRLDNLRQLSSATGNEILIGNQVKLSRKSCSITLTTLTSSSIAKVPTTATVFSSQRVLVLKRKRRLLELRYGKQQLRQAGLVKHDQQKSNIGTTVNLKQPKTNTKIPSSIATISRSGLKLRFARIAEEIICIILKLGFSYLIFVLYRESIPGILRFDLLSYSSFSSFSMVIT